MTDIGLLMVAGLQTYEQLTTKIQNETSMRRAHELQDRKYRLEAYLEWLERSKEFNPEYRQ